MVPPGSGAQWKAFLTTFAAWVLDAFDLTVLTFALADIQQSFSVNKALAGLLGTGTLLSAWSAASAPGRSPIATAARGRSCSRSAGTPCLRS